LLLIPELLTVGSLGTKQPLRYLTHWARNVIL